MSYQPVSGIVPQYSDDSNQLASGFYLKFYIANTTTPLSMATDGTGGTLLVKAKLNPDGLPISNPLDNDTVFIPHVNQDYRLVIYRNEEDADANNTAGAFLNVPSIEPLTGNTVTTSTGPQTVAVALDDRVVRVGSVAGLADLTPVEGKQYSIWEFWPGTDVGGGDVKWDAGRSKTEHNGITVIDPNKLSELGGVGVFGSYFSPAESGTGCFLRPKGRHVFQAEVAGALEALDDNSIPFNAQASVLGRIDGKKGAVYRFTDQVSLLNNFIFNGNFCSVSFGDGHLNLFNLLANVDYVVIRNVFDTEVEGVSAGNFCHKNFYSSYEDDGSVSGFPTGTPYIAKVTRIKSVTCRAARIFSKGDVSLGTSFFLDDAKMEDDTIRVEPCSVLANGHATPKMSFCRLRSDYKEDAIKFSAEGRGLRLFGNKIEHTGDSYLAQIDVFTGLEGSDIYSNELINVQYHRKQTGIDNPTPTDGDSDSLHHNKFYIQGLASGVSNIYAVYWRGTSGDLSHNIFKYSVDPGNASSIMASVFFDSEDSETTTPDQTQPSRVTAAFNKSFFEGSGGGSTDRVSFLTDVGGFTELSLDFMGNQQYGGNRFLSGQAWAVIGNHWITSETVSGTISATVSTGNTFPSPSLGINSKADVSFGTATAGVLDGNRNSLFRVVSADGPITDISNGTVGQVVTIYARTSITVTHSATILLNGSVDASMPTRSCLTLMKTRADDGGGWQEVSRSF